VTEHPHTAAVGSIIRTEMAHRGWTPETLAEALGVRSDTTVRRWLDGRTGLTFDRLVAIEHTLGLPRGYLLRHAGLVDDPRTARDWLEADPRLVDPVQRRLVVEVYDACVKRSREGEPSGLASRRSESNIDPTRRRRARS
jgi:transcriptional regulator with XRE-family HTH domain